MTNTMRAARIHGIRDVRIDELEIPEPGPRELLVRIEACGVCPTDARKYQIGVNDGVLPFNPGHEWIGQVVSKGADTDGWDVGQRVAGDAYAGYAEYATLPTYQRPGTFGALAIDDAIPADRAVFIEPLSCALHALYDKANFAPGQSVVVIGAGQMGLQITAAAAADGGQIHVVEKREDRRELASSFGAEATYDGDSSWVEAIRDASGGADIVVLSVGIPDLIKSAIRATRHGGQVVLFAGFGTRGVQDIDVNDLHYREISLVGSTASGYRPEQQRHRFEQARGLLQEGRLALERLVTGHCDLDGIPAALEDVAAQRTLKTVLVP